MNYIFHILWFEDSQAWYKRASLNTKKILATHCLECEIDRVKNSDFDPNKLTTNYDLIVMDYDLHSEETGDYLIRKIRDEKVFTDILFYSSEYDAMLNAVAGCRPPIDGVFYASRKNEEFNEKLVKVIDKIVCRAEDLINLRGFVLENTSDFELRIKEIINICHQKLPAEKDALLARKLEELLDKKSRNLKTSVSKVAKAKDAFAAANNDDYLLSISDRLEIMDVILPLLSTEYGFDQWKEKSTFKDYYYNNVGTYRNRLGHVKCGDHYIELNGRKIPINQDLHRLLRSNITECEKAIASIEAFVLESV